MYALQRINTSSGQSAMTQRKVSRESAVLKAVFLQAISPLILATPAILFNVGFVTFDHNFKKKGGNGYVLVLYSATVNLLRFSATLNAIIAFKCLIPFKKEFARRILRKTPEQTKTLFTHTPTALSIRRQTAVSDFRM